MRLKGALRKMERLKIAERNVRKNPKGCKREKGFES